MKTPPFLKKGDAIAIIAPSFGATTEPYLSRYLASKKNLIKRGYRIIEGKNVFRNDGAASSAPAKDRAEEFMEAYKSEAKAIISVGGGELMCEILPYIDFEELKKLPPKWFMGFSDNTNLTYTLTTICDIPTIYGPNAASFYEKPLRLNQLDAFEMLEGKKELKGYPKWCKPNPKKKETNPTRKTLYRRPKIITAFNYEKAFEGTLLGGCLDCIMNLIGTKYDRTLEFIGKHSEGIIWYLEACDLSPLEIRRVLFEMREAGYFKNAKGFLFGRPLCYDKEEMGINRTNAITGVLSDLNLPTLTDIDLGHFAPSMPFKNGIKAVVGYEDGNITVKYKE